MVSLTAIGGMFNFIVDQRLWRRDLSSFQSME